MVDRALHSSILTNILGGDGVMAKRVDIPEKVKARIDEIAKESHLMAMGYELAFKEHMMPIIQLLTEEEEKIQNEEPMA